jgi:hypothetical protein
MPQTPSLLYKKFFRTISNLIPGDPLTGKEESLSRLNPNKIYVENVRSLLDVSHQRAVSFCEIAVRQGWFSRHVEVLCPDGSVVTSAINETELPKTVRCWKEENGNLEEVELDTDSLQKVTFYRLSDDATTT